MIEAFFKSLVFCLLLLSGLNSQGQRSFSKSKFNANFTIEKLMLGKWQLADANIISADGQDTSEVLQMDRELECFDIFSKKKGIFDEYFSNSLSVRLPYPALRSYRIVKSRVTNELRLIILEKGDSTVFRNYQIEAFSFNRIVLAKYSDLSNLEGSDKTLLTYEHNERDGQTRSLGAWLHYGSFSVYNLADTDSLEHTFYRVEKEQDIRDSLNVGDLTFQLELLTDETYFTFCTGGVLGSVNLGKFKIDLMKQRLYFFEKDHLVYDYYFNSDSELVLKLNLDLTPLNN